LVVLIVCFPVVGICLCNYHVGRSVVFPYTWPREHFRAKGRARLLLAGEGTTSVEGELRSTASVPGTAPSVRLVVREPGYVALFERDASGRSRRLWPPEGETARVPGGLTDTGIRLPRDGRRGIELYLAYCDPGIDDTAFRRFERFLRETEPGEEPAYEQALSGGCMVDRRQLGPSGQGGCQ